VAIHYKKAILAGIIANVPIKNKALDQWGSLSSDQTNLAPQVIRRYLLH
jgi:hypothetical protein